MVAGCEFADVRSAVGAASAPGASAAVVVIGVYDSLDDVVAEGASVAHLNGLWRTRVVRVASQEEVVAVLQQLFSSQAAIRSVVLFRWAFADFRSLGSHDTTIDGSAKTSEVAPDETTRASQCDHALLNLAADAEWFAGAQIVVNTAVSGGLQRLSRWEVRT